MDEGQRGRLQELRAELEQVRQKKHKSFDDLNKLVQKVYRSFPEDFPDRTVTKRGSRVVYHSNAPGVYPISIEREHGSREYVPPRYAKFALNGIESLLDYVEGN
jgi:hypothetical protein